MSPLPILTIRGFVLAGILLLGPLAGILFDLSLAEGMVISLGVLALLCIELFLEYLQICFFIKDVTFSGRLPGAVYSGLESVLFIEVELPRRKIPLELLLHPESLSGISVKTETYRHVSSSRETFFSLGHSFCPLHRGELVWRKVFCRVLLPLKIFSWQVTASFQEEVKSKVYPNPFCQRKNAAAVFHKQAIGSTPFEYAGGEGREFDSLRPYALGDDLRRVDWKRSAKRNSLLVKVYRPETHQRVYFILDCSRRMGIQVGKRLQLDYAADGAAHLLNISSDNDDEVGLFAFHHRVLSEVPARRGRVQRKLLMNEMMGLEAGMLEGDYELLGEWARRCKRRSLMILLTSISNPASVDTLKGILLSVSRKHLPLVVAIYDRDLQAMLEKPVSSLSEGYIQGAAFEQLEAIQGRMKVLRKVGIECVYSDVLDIPDVLRKKYYQLKLSGRL